MKYYSVPIDGTTTDSNGHPISYMYLCFSCGFKHNPKINMVYVNEIPLALYVEILRSSEDVSDVFKYAMDDCMDELTGEQFVSKHMLQLCDECQKNWFKVAKEASKHVL